MVHKYVKKLIVYLKKKGGKIDDDEINSISDIEAEEYLEKCPIDSLIDLNRGDIYLQKGLFLTIDGFIACIGKPGQGKSSLCSAFYKTLYGLNKEIFSIADSKLTFTKGLWIIKERERRSIRENIIKDIIDVEGFQADDLNTWKYIMIVAFISTDIIVVNRDATRMDEVKKMMSIIWNSLEKMKQLGLPKILKTIWVQISDEDELPKFKQIMEEIDNPFEKWKEKNIEIKSIFIEAVDKKTLKKAHKNILEVESYLEQTKEAFLTIQKENMGESVSTLLAHIDNFNNTLNGEHAFNMETIKKEIERDFYIYYLIQKNKKEAKLLEKYTLDKFIYPINSRESFNDFINKQKIDFSFDRNDVKEKLTFYGSSIEFDKIYNELMDKKDYKADEKIFLPQYDILIAKIKNDEEIENEREKIKKEKLDAEKKNKREFELFQKEQKRQKAFLDFRGAKLEINKYFSLLKFYDDIDSYSSNKYNIEGDYDNNIKNDYNKKLLDYYKYKEKEIRKNWSEQIERSKYKAVVQAYGVMECEKGCK